MRNSATQCGKPGTEFSGSTDHSGGPSIAHHGSIPASRASNRI